MGTSTDNDQPNSDKWWYKWTYDRNDLKNNIEAVSDESAGLFALRYITKNYSDISPWNMDDAIAVGRKCFWSYMYIPIAALIGLFFSVQVAVILAFATFYYGIFYRWLTIRNSNKHLWPYAIASGTFLGVLTITGLIVIYMALQSIYGSIK
jgi:hypothetical protein